MTLNFDTLKASLVLYGLDAVYALVLLVIGWCLAGAAQRFVGRVLSVTHRVDPLVTAFVSSLARYGILAIVGIAVLQLFGIQTASLVAVLGATSLAIGLALQGTLSNLAAGVMLLLFRPFRIGQDVEVGGKRGSVKSLSLFMTELVAPDNTQVLLPNGSVWGQPIINHSAYPGTGELKISFPVPAGTPARIIGDRILEHLRNDPRIDRKISPAVHVSKVVDIANADAPWSSSPSMPRSSRPTPTASSRSCSTRSARSLLSAPGSAAPSSASYPGKTAGGSCFATSSICSSSRSAWCQNSSSRPSGFPARSHS